MPRVGDEQFAVADLHLCLRQDQNYEGGRKTICTYLAPQKDL